MKQGGTPRERVVAGRHQNIFFSITNVHTLKVFFNLGVFHCSFIVSVYHKNRRPCYRQQAPISNVQPPFLLSRQELQLFPPFHEFSTRVRRFESSRIERARKPHEFAGSNGITPESWLPESWLPWGLGPDSWVLTPDSTACRKFKKRDLGPESWLLGWWIPDLGFGIGIPWDSIPMDSQIRDPDLQGSSSLKGSLISGWEKREGDRQRRKHGWRWFDDAGCSSIANPARADG